MPRSSLPSTRALVGLIFVACSVYEIPPVDGTEHSGEGGGGSSSAVSGRGPTIGGTGVKTDAGSAHGGSAGATNGGNAGHGGIVEPTPTGGAGEAPAEGGTGGEPPSPSSGGAGGATEAVDDCPDDPDKVSPGACGCGLPDTATALLASCKTLTAKLIHRYDFEGSGTAVTDRVGASDGTIVGGVSLSKLAGRGVVQLAGGTSGAYVDLPNALISSLTSASFEAWITWGGGANFQRVFDFGSSDHATPENNPKTGTTYIFVSPKTSSNVVTFGYSLTGPTQEQLVAGSSALPQALSQVVAVADATGDALTLYVNGVQVGTRAWTGALSSISDVNVWLGRSQYNSDPELAAVYHEFRVYGAALSAAEVATAFKAGTDPDFMPK